VKWVDPEPRILFKYKGISGDIRRIVGNLPNVFRKRYLRSNLMFCSGVLLSDKHIDSAEYMGTGSLAVGPCDEMGCACEG
jgi:hypothetical protein